ncbi:DNA-binding protein [Enemella dayhoffiae]|uniref:DNA-binding protein n=1 Tax=Enemella dayhoffiae TaxID=2016507 RepID=A0A255HAI4_9ACTN|nr:TraR/DksA family transcriptional regulator [Enemella dayhoffiae]OYO24669.1 DNA-binding protein [Enemella dayhoffiae]
MPTAKKAAAAGTTTAKKTSGAANGQGTTKKKSTARSSTAKSAEQPTEKAAATQAPAAEKTPAKKAPAARKAPARKAAAPAAPAPAEDTPRKVASKPSEFPVRPGEDKWTKAELDEVRQDLANEIVKHRRAIEQAEAELRALLSDGADGAGRDAADIGSANFERDQEMSLAASAREMLNQSEQALRLIDQGLYGRCESCGDAIGKGRLQVYPRATMCVACKQRHERR